MPIQRTKDYVCPHCGDGSRKSKSWCYELEPLEDGRRITLCEHQVQPADGWEVKSFGKLTDKNNKPYYIEKIMDFVTTEKAPRPVNSEWQSFEYPDENGNPFVVVKRKNIINEKGQPDKVIRRCHYRNSELIWNTDGIDSSKVPPYNYQTIKNLPLDTPIFVAEGELTAESYRSIGLFSTTLFGGCNGWNSYVASLLKGRQIVICPDLDVEGVKFAEKIHKDFPNARFFYAYDQLSKSGGLDGYDYILDQRKNGKTDKEIKELILSKIEDKPRDWPQLRQKTNHPKGFNNQVKWEYEQVAEEASRIYWEERGSDQILGAIHKLANKSQWGVNDVQGIYRAVAEELDKLNNKESALAALSEILRLSKKKLDMSSIFPSELAEVIKTKAKNLNLDPQRFLGVCLAGLSSLLGSKLFVKGRRFAEWEEYFRIFYADIAPPSTGKSQVLDSGLSYIKLKERERANAYIEAEKQLKVIKANWTRMDQDEKNEKLDTEENPDIFEALHCNFVPLVYNNGTNESMQLIMSQKKSHESMLVIKDELSSLFEGMNQYKGGKGNDRQFYLTGWNGRNYESYLFKTQKPIILRGQTLNVIGGIQTHLAKRYLNLNNDLDGFACRFLYCQSDILPPKNVPIYERDFEEDIFVFNEIFEKADKFGLDNQEDGQIKPQAMELDDKAYLYWGEIENRLNILAYHQSVTNPTLSSYIGKMKQYYLVFCGLIHFIKWCFDSSINLYQIDLDSAQKAWLVAEFFLGQFIAIQGSSEAFNKDSLTGIYKDIIEYCQIHEKITTREIYRKFPRKIDGEKMTAQKALEIQENLVKQGLGEMGKDGKTFYYKPTTDNALLTPSEDSLSKRLEDLTSEASRSEVLINPPQMPRHKTSIQQFSSNQVYCTVAEEKMQVESAGLSKDSEPLSSKDSDSVNKPMSRCDFVLGEEVILAVQYDDPRYPSIYSRVRFDWIAEIEEATKRRLAQITHQGKALMVYFEHLISVKQYESQS